MSAAFPITYFEPITIACLGCDKRINYNHLAPCYFCSDCLKVPPLQTKTFTCKHCGGVVVETKPGGMLCCTKCNWKTPEFERTDLAKEPVMPLPENPVFGPKGVSPINRKCPSCGELPRQMKPDKPASCGCGRTIVWDNLDDPHAENRSIPSLESHVEAVARNATRLDKAIDFLIGEFIGQHFEPRGLKEDGQPIAVCDEKGLSLAIWLHCERCLHILELTRHRPDLPNRIRLLELVEKAMPPEETK